MIIFIHYWYAKTRFMAVMLLLPWMEIPKRRSKLEACKLLLINIFKHILRKARGAPPSHLGISFFCSCYYEVDWNGDY